MFEVYTYIQTDPHTPYHRGRDLDTLELIDILNWPSITGVDLSGPYSVTLRPHSSGMWVLRVNTKYIGMATPNLAAWTARVMVHGIASLEDF